MFCTERTTDSLSFFNISNLILSNFIDSLITSNLLHSIKRKYQAIQKMWTPYRYLPALTQNFLLATYFVDSLFFSSIILLRIRVLASGRDSCSDIIEDLVQNIRLIYLNHFFMLCSRNTCTRRTKDVLTSSRTTEPFLNAYDVHNSFHVHYDHSWFIFMVYDSWFIKLYLILVAETFFAVIYLFFKKRQGRTKSGDV